MPPPRKVGLLPPELRQFLREELVARGFADYEGLAEQLNARLARAGLDLRIAKSALHAWGQEYREFVRIQEEASAWARDWLEGEGLEGEAQRHSVLFQMLTALSFKWMRAQMAEGAEPDPKELHYLGRMMRDLMQSAGLREKLVEEERRAQAARLDAAEAAGEIDAAAAARAREIMGFA